MKSQVPTAVIAGLIAGLAALLVVSGWERSAENEPAASSAESTMQITGAGSSFAAPMFDKWF
jgi:ABC-type phosphate transport system substrate-binding protein